MKLARSLLSALLMGAASFTQALEIKSYSAAALAAAEEAGQPVAVHFHADWCPTCRAQDKTLQGLMDEKDLDITVLTADYDGEKELKRRFNVNSQSTLVVLKGKREAARLVGDSSADGLRAALKAAL